MSGRVRGASAWIYQGVWRFLVDWFRVPAEPPSLPSFGGEGVASFRPGEGFLRYLKFYFWLLLLLFDGVLIFAWVVLLVALPIVGIVLAIPVWAIAIIPDILAYIAIHLRYDTTWYVLTERSLRIRRGIWIIRETTITYENVQNIRIDQGPLQRYFGIANVLVETAGGGSSTGGEGAQVSMAGHHGLIEGVAEAQQIRDLILSRLRRSTTGGLGDEAHPANHGAFTPEHLAALRDIRDAVSELRAIA